MKKVLAFDIDQTLNVAKTPITDDIAKLLIKCLDHFEICPISGQKFDQFLIQIVDRLRDNGVTDDELTHLHLFVAQGTQYYRYNGTDWEQIYNYPLTNEQVAKISAVLEQAARELGLWANEAWGSYWNWDPKETWAFITWTIFAIYLHTRKNKKFEGVNSSIVASIGFLIIWICYLGINLLGIGLHSYGSFTSN